MKQTTLKEIKEEEKKYFGKEIEDKEYEGPKLSGYSGMSVEWLYPLSDTYYDWVNAAIQACLCTWEREPYSMVNGMSSSEKEKLLLNILKDRPISVALEMPKFAFRINGLSRAMTHQLVRHRQWAFGQQSIRVVNPINQMVRVPENMPFADSITYKRIIKECHEMYLQMVENGIPREQARNILPIGTTTSIICTVNMRYLIEYFQSRTISISQGEHHFLVYLIAKEMEKFQPKFFRFICTKVKGLKELVESEGKGLIGGSGE